MLQMLELTADPVQEETKVDTSAHLQSTSVIRHSVHRTCCQSAKYEISSLSTVLEAAIAVAHERLVILRQKPEPLKWTKLAV